MVKSVYKACGWDLIDERYLQVMGLLAAMPLSLPNGLSADLKRMKRFKTMLTTTAASIAPLQGEHTGGHIPVLLIGGATAVLLVAVPERGGQPQRRGVRQVGFGQVGVPAGRLRCNVGGRGQGHRDR
jgi:hypothetical protein